jgi:hypothetical protein
MNFIGLGPGFYLVRLVLNFPKKFASFFGAVYESNNDATGAT